MSKISDQYWFVGKVIQGNYVTRATSEYAWARVTDDMLSKIKLDDLKKDYVVQFVDWDSIPAGALVKTLDPHSEQEPFLIWCRKYEIHQHTVGIDVLPVHIVYRPVKKADIPVASFD